MIKKLMNNLQQIKYNWVTSKFYKKKEMDKEKDERNG